MSLSFRNFPFSFALIAAAWIAAPTIAVTTSSAAEASATHAASDVSQPQDLFWIKVRAKDKFERTRIADLGVTIETIKDDYVVVIGSKEHLKKLQGLKIVESSYKIDLERSPLDFPAKDANFHNYEEMRTVVQDLATRFPQLTALDSIGKSHEGRELFRLRISGDLANADAKPAVVFMGGHHAREHLSIEMPILLAKHLLENYATDAEIQRLVDGRDIHIIPMVNPDGAEHDIADGNYKFWRKNRRDNGRGSYGVDLNRNYGYKWGTGGSSKNPDSDTYMGPSAFSEPETQAIKNFVDNQKNLTTLLSFHTFSELILYPWGGSYDQIANVKDRSVFEKMAQTMAGWNKYTPQKSSDLYIASGDTTDWAYGTHNIFAFTFELDPADMWGGGGFYPGQAVIPVVFQKNLRPCLYLIEYSDNPYRVLEPTAAAYGLSSPLIN